jgi:hypothetical protein
MSDLQEKNMPSGPISRQVAYSKASSHFKDALDTVIDVMKNSKNDNARLGAANTIIDKVVPDLKATEFTGENGNEILIKILDYAKHTDQHNTPVETTGSTDKE